eukprot:7144686-Alexandrium_andersonii.AAC.1
MAGSRSARTHEARRFACPVVMPRRSASRISVALGRSPFGALHGPGCSLVEVGRPARKTAPACFFASAV